MKSMPMALILALVAGTVSSGCGKKEEATQPRTASAQPEPSAKAESTAKGDSTAKSVATAQPAPESSTRAPSSFDIDKVPVVNPQLGKFPYVGLIDGYRRREDGSKDVAFDRYEFFDGAKTNTVEGRLTTIEAEGQGSSAHQVFKTYESLVTGLGGVNVFEGTAEKMEARDAKFSEMRHRRPVYSGDQMGVYLLRTPEKDIWVEAYVKEHYGREGTYFLTVVEKKALEVKASLLPAEEMKKELDAKGHVALYINFDFDKADIKPDSKPIIDQIVKLLKNNPSLNITVEGHTDNVGTPAYNTRLSDARARSVVSALTAEGIEARRLKAMGYGQDKPIADNSTDDGKARNRRVELVKIT